MERLYFASCHIAAFILLLCSWFLWLRRKEGSASRKALSGVFLIIGILFTIRIVLLYAGIGPFGSSSMFTLLQVLFIITTYSLFPARTILPRLFRRERLALLYLPFIIYSIIYAVSLEFGADYFNFDAFKLLINCDIWSFTVLFRFLIYLTPQLLTVLMIMMAFRYSSVKRVRIYVIYIPFFSILATLMFFVEQYFYTFIMIYHLYSAIIAIYLTYHEIFEGSVVVSKSSMSNLVASKEIVNLQMPVKEGVVVGEPEAEYDEDLSADEDYEGRAVCNQELWWRLERFMLQQEPWRNPELRLNDLAQMMLTNRTTLSQTIHANGYERFYDYIAKYRIDAFCKKIKTGQYDSIKSAFIEVGFMSKSGAFKQFKLIHNMTPGEYIALLNSVKKT